MTHQTLDKMSSTALMIPKENGDEKVVIITPGNGVGKILIREDTILANLQGCAGCGRAHFACSRMKNQWSVLCWGKKSDKKHMCLLMSLMTTFVLSLIGTIFFCFTNAVNDAILSNMVLRNNSHAFEMWQHPTVQPVMKVHIFNYTNWQSVKNGYEDKLVVKEVGPFVYQQDIERVNAYFEGDFLNFQERNTFTYLPYETTGAHFDQVYVPNLPLLGVISKAVNLDLPLVAQFSLNAALAWVNHPHAFLKLPVHRFLWGYEDTIVDTAKPFMSISGQLKFDKFGLLVTKNGTVAEKLTINTGQKDISRINIIEKLDGQTHLNFWGSPECNSIEASDGSIFPTSMLDRRQTLYVFFPNICRRLPFQYEKDVETEDGIHLLRYRMPIGVFDDRRRSNQCFCEIDSGTCPPSGVINVTACAMGVPTLASFPHFYLADEKLKEDILGLKPDPMVHDSFIDIHPTLGIVLKAKTSLQINIQVKKTPQFTALKFLKQDLILPVAWIEMSVGKLPESVRSLVYHGTYSTAAVQLGLTWGCVVGLLVSGCCLAVMFYQRRRKPCATLKKIPIELEQK